LLTRGLVRVQNVAFRLLGRLFRAHVHPPEAMALVARRRDLHTDCRHRGPIWEIVALARRLEDPRYGQ
jgi:hypothetical protein